MVEKRVKDLKAVLVQYRRRLQKKIRIRQMILFGSYARGRPHDYSDIDVAIISPDFRGGTKRDYLLLDRTAREVTPLIEAFPYTPQELRRRPRGGFLDEIVRTGKTVYKRAS